MYVANGLVNQTLISVHGFRNPAELSGKLSIPFLLYIGNWQLLSRVVTGKKQPYKMNNITNADIILKFTSFIL